MHKFHFLCTHHRRWLQNNPEAVAGTWLQSYTRSLDLSEEHHYKEAANHAGAAFETAEIALSHGLGAGANTIHRFADSGVLLVQLLTRLGERRIASAVLNSAIGRLEQLLLVGVEKTAILAGWAALKASVMD